jgi:hypothetical protein
MRAHDIETLAKPTSKGGDEVDAFSRKARKALKWRRGEVRGIKTRATRRHRHEVREALRVERY